MAKLKQTAETVIMVSFLVMNLENILARILSFLFFAVQALLEELFSACRRLSRQLHIPLPVAT